MFFVVLLYSLLALPVIVHAGISMSGMQGSLYFQAEVYGCILRTDWRIIPRGKGWAVEPVYGEKKHAKRAGERKIKFRIFRRLLSASADAAYSRQIRAYLQIGFGDAGTAAIASASIRAVLLTLLMRKGIPFRLRIEPEFHEACLHLAAECIFCVRPGDIVFAVIKTAAERRGKRAQNGKTSH